MSKVILLTTESDPVATAVEAALGDVHDFSVLDSGAIGQSDFEPGKEDVLLIADSVLAVGETKLADALGRIHPGLVQFLGCRPPLALIKGLSSNGVTVAGISPVIAPRVANRVVGFAGSLSGQPGEVDIQWGIVGLGITGTELARKLVAAGSPVVVADLRTPRQGVLDELRIRRKTLDLLVSGADVISLHVCPGPTASPLISGRELGLMKPDAVLINTSDSGIVNEQAVLDALSSEKLGGYATDCPGEAILGADEVLASSGKLVITTNPLTNQIGAAQQLAKFVATNVQTFRNGAQVEGRIDLIDFPKIGDPSFWSSKMSPPRN